jgi:Fe-S-cluster containining protein
LAYFAAMATIDLENWQQQSADHQKQFKHFLKNPDKNKVLKQLPKLHNEAFSKIDCLACAACCKNYSPRFKTPDVKRISKHLKLKESVFIDTYLNLDEDGDYVAKSTPCPFLGADNFCSIYEERPSDCKRFPYTDEDVLIKRPVLTQKNSTFCPAVFYVLEKLGEK